MAPLRHLLCTAVFALIVTVLLLLQPADPARLPIFLQVVRLHLVFSHLVCFRPVFAHPVVHRPRLVPAYNNVIGTVRFILCVQPRKVPGVMKTIRAVFLVLLVPVSLDLLV